MFLAKIGFKPNEKDNCVWNIQHANKQLTLCRHVDDILATSESQSSLDWFATQLETKYKAIQRQRGKDIKYLGMRLQRQADGAITLSMTSLLNEILAGVSKSRTDPANDNLMRVPKDSPLLQTKEKQQFHTLVAKLLYLALRIRSDVLVAVAFLTTRVTNPNISDKIKLDHLLEYLNGTRELECIINTAQFSRVHGYIDSSHACHTDVIGHGALVVVVGTTVTHVSSKKMRKVTKDSTAAELVALSNHYQAVISAHEFLVAQGYQVPIPIIFQDNKSTIQMVSESSKNLEDKYIAVRQSMVRDKIIEKSLMIRYMPTALMLADPLTKPLHGEVFRQFRRRLLTGDTDEKGETLCSI